MMFSPELHGRWARERIERQLETAALLRQGQQPSQSIRQAVGQRIAAEPSFELARFR